MNGQSEPSIDRIAAAFFGAFDNRGGRVPSAVALYRLFGGGATVTLVSGADIDVMDVTTFVQPRMDLLASGALVEFHEWEVEARTFVMGNIAARCSVYEKSGLLEGAPYGGRGRKLIQLYSAGESWLISSILWETIERPWP